MGTEAPLNALNLNSKTTENGEIREIQKQRERERQKVSASESESKPNPKTTEIQKQKNSKNKVLERSGNRLNAQNHRKNTY